MATTRSLGVSVSSTTRGPLPSSDSDSEPELETEERGAKRRHIYRPLKPDEIRLLVLNPGASDDPIECYLEHCSIGKAKRFQALSYVWGDARNPPSILLDGFSFPLTQNLRAFLAVYRTEHQAFKLWIDALCINQADMAERQAQIQLMKRVYEGADSIVIWLGHSIDSTLPAFKRIAQIYRNWWEPRLKRERSSHAALMSMTVDDAAVILGVGQKQDGDAGADADAVHQAERAGMEDIFERPWWTRIWVYQEATAPARRGSFVFCGPHSITFAMVLAANRIIRHLVLRGYQPNLFQNLTNKTPVFMQIYLELRRKYQEEGSSHLLKLADLLPTLRDLDATDPRDKLYALIPTSLDGAELLDVTYSLPVAEVYTNSAWAFIKKYRNLDILGHCAGPDHGSPSLSGLPSWVPDWTAKSTPSHFFKRGISGRSNPNAVDDGIDIADGMEIVKLYNAASDSAAWSTRDSTGRKLTCAGITFDQVRHVSRSAGRTPESTDVAQDWTEWLKGVAPTPFHTAREALSHVLVADCFRKAVDIGARGCRASLSSTEEMPSAVVPTGDRMDVTGPHPATFRRRLVVTEKGYVGLTAEHVEVGDRVVILMGGQLPFVLRSVDGHYMLIGEAYIHGIMDGEALVDQGKTEEFEIW